MDFEVITFAIAVISFLMSIWNFVETRLQSRVNLAVSCKDFLYVDFLDTKPLFIGLTISNKSRLQISISRLFINLDGNSYEFSWIPMPIFNARITQNSELRGETYINSLVPPLNLSALSSISGYFAISSHGKINTNSICNSDVEIKLYTNRGIKSYTVSLHENSHDI